MRSSPFLGTELDGWVSQHPCHWLDVVRGWSTRDDEGGPRRLLASLMRKDHGVGLPCQVSGKVEIQPISNRQEKFWNVKAT